MIVHNFETTVTVPQHTVVVPKPACSCQNYTTFRRYFQALSQFCVLESSYLLYHFYARLFLCALACHSSERPEPGASTGGVRPAQMRSSAASFAEISPEVILGDGVGNSAFLFDMEYFLL